MTPEHLEATEERVRVVLLEHVAIPVAVEVRRQVRETLPGASAEVLQHAVEYIAQRMNRYLAERPTALTRDVLIQRRDQAAVGGFFRGFCRAGFAAVRAIDRRSGLHNKAPGLPTY